VFNKSNTDFRQEEILNKSYVLSELTKIGLRSDGVKIKRCVLCQSDFKELDLDCPVCRVIMHLKKKPNKYFKLTIFQIAT
jgi:hypothetical protein